MGKTGVANLPLHPGKAPRWLFTRMVALAQEIFNVISYEYGVDEVLQRLADPFWFQALSCVLGFDWHSSGCTTVTCGALKEAIDPEEHGFAIAGGKGKASRKTLQEITQIGETYNLSTHDIDTLHYASRMAAKIDNTAVQDGHNLYHHVMMFTEKKKWAVIQQGMNPHDTYARRYHWSSETVESFICEPHSAIMGDDRQDTVLDMTPQTSCSAQQTSVDLVNDNPLHLKHDWALLTKPPQQSTLDSWNANGPVVHQTAYLTMPRSINWTKMKEIYDFQPKNYEQLLALKGVGPNTIRALALISDLIYGETPSWKDPVKYSFTVGGKDGVPHPVDRQAMDEATDQLKRGIHQAKIGENEKLYALRRLKCIIPYN